jgi:O-antigen/teichoic acid export membrane protein
VHCKDFTFVLLPRLNRELVEGDIKEFKRAISSCPHYLILVAFGPGEVVESILGVEPG